MLPPSSGKCFQTRSQYRPDNLRFIPAFTLFIEIECKETGAAMPRRFLSLQMDIPYLCGVESSFACFSSKKSRVLIRKKNADYEQKRCLPMTVMRGRDQIQAEVAVTGLK